MYADDWIHRSRRINIEGNRDDSRREKASSVLSLVKGHLLYCVLFSVGMILGKLLSACVKWRGLGRLRLENASNQSIGT